MIVWINGLFGAGKSSVAALLAGRLPGSWLVDPEEIGFGLPGWYESPEGMVDFQDLPLWRSLTCETVSTVGSTDSSHVIVPMTLLNPDYFPEITSCLKRCGHSVRAVALLADPETISARVSGRAEGHTPWVQAMNDRYSVQSATPCSALSWTLKASGRLR